MYKFYCPACQKHTDNIDFAPDTQMASLPVNVPDNKKIGYELHFIVCKNCDNTVLSTVPIEYKGKWTND